MNVLFFHTNGCIQPELQEFISNIHGDAYFATSPEEAVNILNTHPIDVLFLELKRLSDVGLIKYANEHFANVRTILSVESGMQEVISTLQTSHFGILQAPFALKELWDALTQEQ